MREWVAGEWQKRRSRIVDQPPSAGESPPGEAAPRIVESWEDTVKTLYRGALVLWLVSGFGLHAYFSRAAQGTAAVEQKRDLHLRQFENDDAVARRIREAHWKADARMTLGYGAWALVGFVLASAACVRCSSGPTAWPILRSSWLRRSC